VVVEAGAISLRLAFCVPVTSTSCRKMPLRDTCNCMFGSMLPCHNLEDEDGVSACRARWSQFNPSFANPLPSWLGRTRYHSNLSGRRPSDSTQFVPVVSLFLFWLLNLNPLILNPTLEFTHFTRIKPPTCNSHARFMT
jgi:hypothetical protein